MKKYFIASISLITTVLFIVPATYGNIAAGHLKFSSQNTLLQDTTHKKSVPTKKAEVDRTKGESGEGQGKGTDTIPASTGSGKQGQDTAVIKNSQQNDQNSDNRGEGADKNNRAGNAKRGTDTTRH